MRRNRCWWVSLVVGGLVGCTSLAGEGGATSQKSLTLEHAGRRGPVAFEFLVNEAVPVGDNSEFVRWTAQTGAIEATPVWAGIAIEGLPPTCHLEVRRWEDVEADIEAGRPPDDSRYNLTMDDGQLTSAKRSPVASECAGDYRLHVSVIGDGQTRSDSVAITIA